MILRSLENMPGDGFHAGTYFQELCLIACFEFNRTGRCFQTKSNPDKNSRHYLSQLKSPTVNLYEHQHNLYEK